MKHLDPLDASREAAVDQMIDAAKDRAEMFPPMKLSNNPHYALSQIAAYIRTARLGTDRAIVRDGEIVGYWQTADWLDGLSQIGSECDRVSVLPVD